MKRPHFQIPCQPAPLLLGQNTCIMGILNTTPDSFSDGGQYLDPHLALDRAQEMVEQGAHIIDIGGESSRPKGPYGQGAQAVSLEEELKRTIPIIQKLAPKISTPISIDTTKAEVAKQALEAGAALVNDISALRTDPKMVQVISNYQVPIVLMHMQGTPQTMQQNPTYTHLIEEILTFFKTQINTAIQAGISKENIIIDPGFGFGKRYAHNLDILAHLDAFHTLKYPILVGPSRKQFTGPKATPPNRLPGTLAALVQCVLLGAHIVRVHDVWQTQQALNLTDQLLTMQRVKPLTKGSKAS